MVSRSGGGGSRVLPGGGRLENVDINGWDNLISRLKASTNKMDLSFILF
jgi:hypothetical protein